jgi:hypothetical protein
VAGGVLYSVPRARLEVTRRMAAVMIQAGDRRGDYSFLERIGRGAFGEVWKALHVPTGERVAVKIEPESAPRPPFTRRIVQLDHPNIVRTRERVEAGGAILTVMDLADARSLRDLLQERRALPLDEAAEIADQILAGLAHAHAAGIAHLDLKPENVLMSGGTARVCDFGSAREAPPDPELRRSLGGDEEEDRRLVGSVGYMAPEQRLGLGRASVRSDVYSIGAILYELMTGQLPLGAFRYPSSIHPEIPPAVDDLLRQCLQPSPEARFSDAGQVREALREAVAKPGAPLSALQMRGVDEVRSIRELVEYALAGPAGWEEVRRQLLGGELEGWLRRTRHSELARTAESLRATEPDRDQAVERLLEASGVFDPPALDVEEVLDLGEVRRGETASVALRLIKRGRGYLAGDIRPGAERISARPGRFRFTEIDRPIGEATIEVRLDTEGLDPYSSFEETLQVGHRMVRVRARILPRPARLTLDPPALALVCIGPAPLAAVVEVRNPGDLETALRASASAPWIRVDAPETLDAGGRARVRLGFDPGGAERSGALARESRMEGEVARASIRFEGTDSTATLQVTLIRTRRFDLKLFFAGLAMGLVPVWAELMFLTQAAELGLGALAPRPEGVVEEGVRRASRRRQGFSLLLGLMPGLLIHLALLVRW